MHRTTIDYFLHATATVDGRFGDIDVGQVVEFDAIDGPRGLRCENATILVD